MLIRFQIQSKMVQALTILSALQLFSEAKIPELPSCNANGRRGVIRYERLADVRRDPASSDLDIISLSEIPSDVLFKCQDKCLKDETPKNSAKRPCGSLDFVPGQRLTKRMPTSEYTKSKCILTMPPDNPREPPKYQVAQDFYHYREVCYSGSNNEQSRAATDCPQRMYVMERIKDKRFMPTNNNKEVNANSIEECQQICLNQAAEDPLITTMVCRSGTFDRQRNRCYLSTFTRRTHSSEFIDDPAYDYFENTCLSVERRCPIGKLFWTKETDSEMTGPYDFQIYQNMTLNSCRSKCLYSKSMFCRSIEFDQALKTCVLSDEDSISRPNHIIKSVSDQNLYLELICMDGTHKRIPPRELIRDRQHLAERDDQREVQTAFQLFRDRRLQLSPGFREKVREGDDVSLAECLDACLEERKFDCRSAGYSARTKACRLSEFDRINGDLMFDSDFHYFENLMSGNRLESSSNAGSSHFNTFESNSFGRFRPGSGGVSDQFTGGDRFQESKSGTYFDSGASNFIYPFESNYNQRPSSLGYSGPNPGSGRRPTFNSRPYPSFGSSSGSDFDNVGSSFIGQNNIFEPVGSRLRLRAQYIREITSADDLNDCIEECVKEGSFVCRSLNFRYGKSSLRDNCELSSVNSRNLDIRNPSHFDTNGDYDFFERKDSGNYRPPPSHGGGNRWPNHDRLDVSQKCHHDGTMDFMLKTSEPFRGRIYTNGYYDRCFYRGDGRTATRLKITPTRGFPDCGTMKYDQTTSNIVVVQFADGVMTSMDKKYNLTCTTVGPGDSVVTSAYIGAGLGQPIPIEFLPEVSRLENAVRLQILYGDRPTTTVAVGDPLRFKIESLAGPGLISDIFATDVIARDPVQGRSIQLIDSRGCPTQPQVFPALGRSRSGEGLETKFSAFKLPDANLIVFEAKVRVCRRACQPAVCTGGGIGRSGEHSYGKKRRRRSAENNEDANANITDDAAAEESTEVNPFLPLKDDNEFEGTETEVTEVLKVYMYNEEAQERRDIEAAALMDGICIPPSQYYSLLSALFISIFCVVASLLLMGYCYRRHRNYASKNAVADSSNPHKKNRSAFPGSHPRTVNQPARYFPSRDDRGHSSMDLNSRQNRFPDPSEPIYTDPTLFERSPSGATEETTSARL